MTNGREAVTGAMETPFPSASCCAAATSASRRDDGMGTAPLARPTSLAACPRVDSRDSWMEGIVERPLQRILRVPPPPPADGRRDVLSELPRNGVDYRDCAIKVELGEVPLAQHWSQFRLQLPPQLAHSAGQDIHGCSARNLELAPQQL